MDTDRKNKRLFFLAKMIQAGTTDMQIRDDFARICYETASPGILAAVKKRKLRFADSEDVLQAVVLRACTYIRAWDPAKGQVTTWLGGITGREILKMQQRYLEDTVTQQVIGEQYVDLRGVVPCEEIRCEPDACYEWDEQIGRWMCDEVAVDAGMLAKLRNQLLKKYGLRKAYMERKQRAKKP